MRVVAENSKADPARQHAAAGVRFTLRQMTANLGATQDALTPLCPGQSGKRTRLPCRAPAMPNGRCRMHGGASTGPRTAEGVARITAARTRHGLHGAEMRDVRRWAAELRREARELLEAVE